MNSLIHLRLMAELADDATALHLEQSVQTRLSAFGNLKRSETKRYWKIPEWFEIDLCLEPTTDPVSAYNGVLASLGEGWERHDFPDDQQWAVWNPGAGCKFFSPQFRWAHAERYPESWEIPQ